MPRTVQITITAEVQDEPLTGDYNEPVTNKFIREYVRGGGDYFVPGVTVVDVTVGTKQPNKDGHPALVPGMTYQAAVATLRDTDA